MKHFISLGGGIQSSVLCFKAALGQISPMPEGAIFADTGGESQETYDWIDYLEKEIPFPIHRIMHKEGLESQVLESLKSGGRQEIPLHIRDKDGKKGLLPRMCTRTYKIEPLTRCLRDLLKLKKGQRFKSPIAKMWIGISTDEISRLSVSRAKFYENRFPLIEEDMGRGKCIEWLKESNFPTPPKSACYFCGFRTDQDWKALKENSPKEWGKALEIDKAIRVSGEYEKFLHRSAQPLESADLRTDTDKGQELLWNDECMGMCGV